MAIDHHKDLTVDAPPKEGSYAIGGVPVSVTNLREAVDRIVNWSRHPRGRFVCVRDLHGLVLALEDPLLAQIHRDADMVTPDGMPLVWIGRARGLPVGRACGADLMSGVVERSATVGFSQFFLGGRPGVASRLSMVFSTRHPSLRIAGIRELPFSPVEEYDLDGIVRDINASRAHIVWVGLSTPRQELLMHLIARRTRATFIGVGAAFDFHCGDIKRAPRWMQRSGLEWLYRITQDPGRLGPRYLRLIWKVARFTIWKRAD